MIILPREILSSIFQNVPIFFYSIQRNTLTNMEKVITHFQFFFSRMYSFSFSLFCYSICYNIDISKDKKYVMERKFKPGVDCYDSVCIITKKWRYRDSNECFRVNTRESTTYMLDSDAFDEKYANGLVHFVRK
jgi:hypothetical protein